MQCDDEEKENATPVKAVAFVGPTPQKDGRVLGLFDLLPEDQATPSKKSSLLKPRNLQQSAVEDRRGANSTPSKTSGQDQHLSATEAARIESTPTTINRHSRTPQSLGKRFLLDSFLTPSKRRRLDDQGTPTSRIKHVQTDTPAFLNRSRSNLASIAEDGEVGPAERLTSKQNLKRPGMGRRGFTRSLSSMIADLRQAEDDRLDEDMGMMREMEDGSPAKRPLKGKADKPTVQIEDSQALGPDGTGAGSDGDEHGQEGLGRDGRPLKVWKKKGQKRTTRRVLIKPQQRRRSPKPEAIAEEESDNDVEPAASPRKARRAAKEPRFEETQHADGEGEGDPSRSEDSDDSHDDYAGDDAEVESDDNLSQSPSKKRKTKDADSSASIKTDKELSSPKEGVLQKTAKKVKATAHANFRALKIRSSKGAKVASKGRFGRGRR